MKTLGKNVIECDLVLCCILISFCFCLLLMYDASGKPVSYPTSVIHGQYPSLVVSGNI